MNQRSADMVERVRLTVVIVYVLFSVALFADSVSIHPSGPTTVTPIDIRYAAQCQPSHDQYTVTVTGNVIKLHFAALFCNVDPPITIIATVPLPVLLEPGEYRVEVMVGDMDAIRATTTFVVRDADPNRPLDVHPSVVPGHQLDRPRVRLSRNKESRPLCPNNTCRLFVDDIEVTNKTVDAQGNLWFTPPPHAPGFADVEIRRIEERKVEMENALYYFDKSKPADLSVFERVLFPMLTSTSGANGSQWRTEAAVLNPKRWFVENYNEILPFQCIDYPCGERIGPGEEVDFEGGDDPHGIALLVPRDEAPTLSFALRARDVSREAEDFGTEIPVLREHDLFFNTSMRLLDVPLEQRYRAKLRVYALPQQGAQILATAYVSIARANGTSTQVQVPLSRSCSTLTCPQTPYYGELDLPAGASGERVDVLVEGIQEALAWSFITVTNDETQQVTIVTPDGKGGL